VVDIRYSPSASFDRLLCVSKGEKPILIQALLSQSAVEAFDESIVTGLAGSAELIPCFCLREECEGVSIY
jgi:hypothetical protein